MAKLNVVNSKAKSKRIIQLDDCDYGVLVKIGNDYCVIIDYDFIGQDSDDIAVLDIETGEVLFVDRNTPVKAYEGEIIINEEQFREFE